MRTWTKIDERRWKVTGEDGEFIVTITGTDNGARDRYAVAVWTPVT